MTVKDMQEILARYPHPDFELEFTLQTPAPEEWLNDPQNTYPYPWNYQKLSVELTDVGYSSKVICFTAEIKEN